MFWEFEASQTIERQRFFRARTDFSVHPPCTLFAHDMRLIALPFLIALAACSDNTVFASEKLSRPTETISAASFRNPPDGLFENQKPDDWLDANNVSQGTSAYASVLIPDLDTSRAVIWDITEMVVEWVTGRHPNNGVMLRNSPDSHYGATTFYDGATADRQLRPQLLIRADDGRQIALAPVTDAHLELSKEDAMKQPRVLAVAQSATTSLRFDLSAVGAGTLIHSAQLRLWTTNRQHDDNLVEAFRVGARDGQIAEFEVDSIASRYPGDIGIEQDANVIVATDFEAFDWQRDWVDRWDLSVFERIDAWRDLKFQPLVGAALAVTIPEGRNFGLDLVYPFKEMIGREPEEIYLRYYLRFADDWSPTESGGKIPGIAGTYDKAGWGGRRSNGFNGWSTRGQFFPAFTDDKLRANGTPIGTYAYHAGMRGTYGSSWFWARDGLPVLVNNRWYAIEQFVRLNTPGHDDGVMRGWIDGRLAFEDRNVRYRDTLSIKIDRIWLNVYHGGATVSPFDQHLFIDNVVVANKYIGPMTFP